ncbi:adenylyl-sulfate kinase [Thermoproteota archaeon]
MEKGVVIWLTGLPGSGKTTVAEKLVAILRKKEAKVEMLDGDQVRKWLSPEAGFSKEDRERHLIRVAHVSRLLARNEVIVVASFVSPYRNVRKRIRDIVEEEEGLSFLEVYAKCSVDTCIKRDPKGLYKKALRGEIKNMTGIDDPFEDPLEPEVIIDTENESPDISANHILKTLEKPDN